MCWNKQTHDSGGGVLVDPDVLAAQIVSGAHPRTSGLSISGGEPFQQAAGLFPFVVAIRRLRPDWSIFSWSGYTMEQIRSQGAPAQALLSVLDILVDGPFDARQRQEGLLWRGSANQRLIGLTPVGMQLLAMASFEEQAVSEWTFGPNGEVVVSGFPIKNPLKLLS